MKLLIGLGNPGEKYKQNRHNVGFMMLDYFVEQVQNSKLKTQNHSLKFKTDKYSHAEIAEIHVNREKIILAKPQTFMNESGKAVRKILTNNQFSIINKFSISNDLYVVHDDLDIRLGEFKIQKGRGPKLHNGIESIENHLHTKDFWRVRIGVDNRNPENRIPGEAYVLQDFTGEELMILKTAFQEIINNNQFSIFNNQ